MKIRKSARLLVIDPEDRFLLFRTDDLPMDPRLNIETYWFLPGGGLESGESFEEAARRELWEETGITDARLGPCVWIRELELNFPEGVGRALSHERYYPAWVEAGEISFDNLTEFETGSIAAHRWWTLDALRASPDVVFPENLAALIEPVIRGELPNSPLTI